ncbi:MAG TPA: DUF305 domain-containing protein [Nocardioidaceae bacterium]|nr:DUF305 domain-containing protein [Nocardioidaceae bacterium]
MIDRSTTRSARVATFVVMLGLATTIAACSSDDEKPENPRVVQLGGPGETGEELSDEEIAELGDAQYTDADVAFVQNMIPHHEQALEMVALIDKRTDNPDLPKLAERMRVSQLAEIDQLQNWLAERDEQLPSGQHHHMAHHEQLMPGMLTDAEMKQLASARGTAFDRLFLQYMIRHHEGAVLMVEDLLASGNGQEPNLFQLAQHIGPDQGIEIARMKLMLTQL